MKQTCTKVAQLADPNSPIPEDHIRFVCLSDTHSRVEDIPLDFVPPGDVLLHSGDFTMIGLPKAIEKFNDYLGKLPHKVKVIIAGNHDLTFDDDMVANDRHHLEMFGLKENNFEKYLQEKNIKSVKELMTNCLYLEDAMVELYGIKIYGSPWLVSN